MYHELIGFSLLEDDFGACEPFERWRFAQGLREHGAIEYVKWVTTN